MRTMFCALAVAVIAARFIAPAASAQPVIDDFETGTFHLTTSGVVPVVGISTPVSPSHAVAGFREVTLATNLPGAPATADLDAWTIVDDMLRLSFAPPGGKATLNYEPSTPVDLTASGQNDRIEVRFATATNGGFVGLQVWDGMGGFAADSLGIAMDASPYTFDFSRLGAADLTDITQLAIWIRGGGKSEYEVRDIRAMRESAFAHEFDVPTETVIGPPFPTEPLIFHVIDTVPSGLQQIRLLNATKIATGGAAGVALTGMDSGGDMGPGFAGAVRASWNEVSAFASTAFDLQVDVDAVSGIEPEPFLPALPEITTTSNGFLLEFDVHYLGGGGQVVTTSQRQMAFDALPGQALQFRGVRVHPPGVLGPSGTTEFRVTFDAVDAGGVDSGEPLFEAMLTGDCKLEIATAVPLAEAAAFDQVLRACPSVTRAGSELRLARPAEGGGRIDVFDVTGRLVRRLHVSRGADGAAWDGRAGVDAAGSGVYFARFTDGRAECVARIVKVR